jgi:hypothetical protein
MPSTIYPNCDFWYENKPSGNPVPVCCLAVGAIDVENGAFLDRHRAYGGPLQASRVNLKKIEKGRKRSKGRKGRKCRKKSIFKV